MQVKAHRMAMWCWKQCVADVLAAQRLVCGWKHGSRLLTSCTPRGHSNTFQAGVKSQANLRMDKNLHRALKADLCIAPAAVTEDPGQHAHVAR